MMRMPIRWDGSQWNGEMKINYPPGEFVSLMMGGLVCLLLPLAIL